MAVTSASLLFLGTDEAAKFIEPATLFWLRGLVGIVDAVALALKGFTSQTFADWSSKRSNGNTQQPNPPTA